jgi:hypothetical protein
MSTPNPDPSSSLGFDWSYAADMFPDGRSASGGDLVGNAILHRLTTDALPLIDSDNDFVEFGDDVRKWPGEGFTVDSLGARAAGIGPVVERDPRVSTAEVTGEMAEADGLWSFKLRVSALLRTGETIERVIGVSSVTAELLAGG